MQPFARCLMAAACAFAFAPLAWAQGWPVKIIRLIVNFPAGSPVDVIARIYASRLGEALGQPIVIDNRAGAAGNIGLDIVARSAPDGYTLLNSSGSPFVLGVHLYKLGFDAARDLGPITPTARASAFLVVRPGLPVRSVPELIALARANPGKLNFASTGNGALPHIAAEMMLRMAKIRVTHVSYKGSPQMITALLGDEVDFTFDPGSAAPYIKAEKLRLLAVASAARSPIFPDTPTMAEAGTDVSASTVHGVFAPVGTPREIVTRLNREINRIMQTAEARAVLASIANEPVAASPEEYATLLRRDRERFGAIIREANIRAD
jgi:tripartite-type tricarboxylate transporter receptor subunit TctC